MLEQYFIALLTTGVIFVGLTIFVILNGFNKRLNQLLALYSLSLAVWSIFEALAITCHSESLALLLWRISHVGVIFIPIFLTHFVFRFLDIKGKRNKLIPISYAIAFIFVILNAISLLVLEIVPKFSFRYFINPSRFYYVFFWLWIAWAIYGNAELFREYFRTSGHRKTQMKYFCWSLLFSYLGGVPNFLPVFNIEIPVLMPYGTYAIPVFAFFTTYAIIRHQLMDIKVIIKKTLIFTSLLAIVLGTFVGITLLTQELIAGGRLLGLVISSIIIIFAVRPLENFLVKVTDKYLFQKKYDYREVLKSFIDEVITVLDLDTVMQKTLELLSKMFHPEQSTILLLDADMDKYVSYGKSGYDKGIVLERASRIPRYLKSSTNILSTEDKETNEELRNEMNNLNARLAMPLIFRDELMGIMLLGKKKSDKIYTKEDLDILTDLAQTEATVVSNSRTHTLLLQAREKEQQAEHLVSLGFVVTNISHELRNPIHIISGAAETALDAIDTELDIKKLDKKNHKTVEYVKTKLKSIMERSNKTHEMLESILHAIKINPANFTDLSLQKTVNEAISRLEPHLKSAGIDIVTDIPDTFPLIKADSIAIEQVFVNLLTNAIHAIEHSKKGDRIQIVASDLDDNVRVEISDNGPGIPEQDIKRIFEPFYTTKDNLYAYKKGRSEGAGLGLMIAYQTITKHSGTINVRSKEGKGTIFVIELSKTIKK